MAEPERPPRRPSEAGMWPWRRDIATIHIRASDGSRRTMRVIEPRVRRPWWWWWE